MKKIRALLFVSLMVLTMSMITACGNRNTNADDGNNTNGTQTGIGTTSDTTTGTDNGTGTNGTDTTGTGTI